MASGRQAVDVAALLDDRRLTPFNYRLIVLSWLITVFDGFDMQMVSFTAPYMRDEFGLSTMMLGNVFAAGTAGMVIGGFFFSYLGDRIGRRPTIIICAFSFGILTLATALAQSYAQLVALRLLDGLAIGGMLPLAWALNIEFVPARMRSTIVTIIMVGYSMGSMSAGPLTNLIAPTHGWAGVYVVGGLGTLVCATGLLFALPESVRFLVSRNRRPELVARTLKRLDPAVDVRADDTFVLGNEAKASAGGFRASDLFRGDLRIITPLLWIGYGVSSLAIYFSSSWGPMVLEALSIPRTTAAWVSSLSSLLGAIAGLLLMRFTDRKGPHAVAFYPALAVPVLLLLGLGFVPPSLFVPFVVMGALLVGGEHQGIISITGVFYPSAIRATGAGWASSIGKIGGVAGPILGAVVLSSGMPVLRSYALLAICPAILGLCAFGIAMTVRRRSGEEALATPVAVGQTA